MKTRVFQTMWTLAIVIWMGSCAILQRETPEKKVREVMLAFQQSLNQPDDEVLKFFESLQSRETLLSAIDILQNDDSAAVVCRADFDNMTIEAITTPGDEGMQVTVAATFTSRASEESQEQQVSLIFYLVAKKDSYVISRLDGDSFYATFTNMKHEIQYASHRHAEIKEREAIYELARTLEEKFDTLVWYAQYNDKVYFYAVTGEWNEEALYPKSSLPMPEYKMGLIDETGKEIIPIEYEMIGILGAEQQDVVEVKSRYGYGYLTLGGDTLVPPEYHQIIPYPQGGVWIVQSEGQYGFIDDRGKYTEGFINANAKQYVEDFAYLASQGTINATNYALCEFPRTEGAGNGHFISPSYYVAASLFEPIQFGFTTTATDAPIGGWTEYVEFDTFFKNVSEGVGVIVASFKERYLEGRSEFYEHTNLMFTDAGNSIVSVEQVNGEDIEIKKISDGLLEIRMTERWDDYDMGAMDGAVQNARLFKYFQLIEGGVSALGSKRIHPETEFVKLDDSYIAGEFKIYNEEAGQWDVTDGLPTATLELMRNEILAEYGMTFQSEETRAYFENREWYSARFQSESEFEESLTEIDKHNLDFLAKILSDRKPPEGDV